MVFCSKKLKFKIVGVQSRNQWKFERRTGCLRFVGSNGTKTRREAEVIAQGQSLGDLNESLQEVDLGQQEDSGSLNKLPLDH
jgi:hypothetical protein